VARCGTRQQAAVPVAGVLSPTTKLSAAGRRPFIQGLAETGYVEGRNVTLDYRFAEYRLERLPALAAELVRRRANVIYAPNLGSALAAKAAAQTIPIVFVTGGDPIKFGLVASLNRPGGNITGVAILSNELIPKRLQTFRWCVNWFRPGVCALSLSIPPTRLRKWKRERSRLPQLHSGCAC
jgi:putative tryptophan/tyrosine transport system substrate-binding protein